MPQSKKRVVVTRKLPDPVETRMMELFSTVLNLSDEPMSREQLAADQRDELAPDLALQDRAVADRAEHAVVEQVALRILALAGDAGGGDRRRGRWPLGGLGCVRQPCW